MTGDFKAGTYEVCCECGLFLQVDKIQEHTSQPCPTEYELLKERMRLDIIDELDRIKTNYFEGYEAEDIVRAEREILSEEFGFTNFLEGQKIE
jgi:hypothetical protein